MKFRPIFYLISFLLLAISIFSIAKWGFVLGIDFAGGTVWEVKFSKDVEKSQIEEIFSINNLKINSLNYKDKSALIKFQNISQDQKLILSSKMQEIDNQYSESRFETLGPSLGKELIQKTVVAIILSTLALLLFIGTRFKDYTFGLAAVLAMLHDSVILVGAFSLLGHFFGAELDALFVTAILTTLSSSVHDTVVTFDRIRD